MTRSKIDHDMVLSVGAGILAAQLAHHTDVVGISQERLDSLADLSVRAALALDGAVPRAQERIAAEERALAEADKAEAAAAESADKKKK